MTRYLDKPTEFLVEQGKLDDKIVLDTPEWFAFLNNADSFFCSAKSFSFKVRKNRGYWQAYRKVGKRLYQKYLGLSESVTKTKLDQTAAYFASPPPSEDYTTYSAKLFYQGKEVGVVTVLVEDGCRLIDVEDLITLGVEVR